MGVDAIDAHDDGLDALVDVIAAMSAELDIATVLERLVDAGCRLTGARYGALGVLSENGGLREFVHRGIDPETAHRIGHVPEGKGVLGQLITDPRPLRLHDLAQDPSSVGFPDHHPPMTTFLGVPVLARGTAFGNLYLTDKAGAADFTTQDEQVAVALAAAAGVALGHARAYHQAREHELWLETAAACTAVLTAGTPRAEAVAAVLARVCQGAAAAGARLYEVVDDLPPVLADDLVARWPVLRRLPELDDAGMASPTWALAVPLRSGDRWVGALVICWPADDGSAGPELDVLTVAAFAEQLALALDVADAQADRARLAVLEERERIARDLHDMVIQRLFAIGLEVQGTAQDVPPEAASRLAAAVDDLDETIKDVRSTIFRLSSRDRAGRTGLRHLLDAEIESSRHALGFVPRLRTDGVTATVPAELGDDAVAVVREALANVARHAHAREVVVHVAVGSELVIEVRDDGDGLPDTVTRSGLANLEERAVRRGGSMRVRSAPAGGTLLQWSVPLT